MHIFFSGIGGTGIGPLAQVAKEAGYTISGSDKQDSLYLAHLRKHGLENINIGQDLDNIARTHQNNPIDWYVYSSAVAIEQPDAPEFQFCRENNIRMSKRDELLTEILKNKQLPLLAIAGTHGKTTTTAMAVWLAKQLDIPAGYILPAKSSFAEMGACPSGAQQFIYECDEFDRNFLHFYPEVSIITGISWDHPDIYPTREDYDQAFAQFVNQSKTVVMWRSDASQIFPSGAPEHVTVFEDDDPAIESISLAGRVNRRNAWQVAQAFRIMRKTPLNEALAHLEKFPGVSRRFEKIADRLYSDYAHTIEKIQGAVQIGHEVAGDNLVVVYEGLHNTRQHFIRDQLSSLFDSVKSLYIVPSYLAREDQSLTLLTPQMLVDGLSEVSRSKSSPKKLDPDLEATIRSHLEAGDTVLCLTAGGGVSLDEWLRKKFV